MKTFWHSLRISTVCLCLFTVLLGVVYPSFICGLGEVFFHHKVHGSILQRVDKTPLGSALIAQNFSRPEYFHPRPSAAGSQGYDASSSSASNWGPTSQKLFTAIQERAVQFREINALSPTTKLPVDAITASGSGLDPHISLNNAKLQATRVAFQRGLPQAVVESLLQKHTEHRFLGLFGEARLNVLKINLALDQLSPNS